MSTAVGFPCLSGVTGQAAFVSLRYGSGGGFWKTLDTSQELDLGLQTARLNLVSLFPTWPLEDAWSVQLPSSGDSLLLEGLSATLAGMLAGPLFRHALRPPWNHAAEFWATGSMTRPELRLVTVDDDGFRAKLRAFLQPFDGCRIFFAPKGNFPQEHLRDMGACGTAVVVQLSEVDDHLLRAKSGTKLIVVIDEYEVPDLLRTMYGVEATVGPMTSRATTALGEALPPSGLARNKLLRELSRVPARLRGRLGFSG